MRLELWRFSSRQANSGRLNVVHCAQMANEEHLDVLKSGVESWNAWRKEHADIRPDLRGADLGRASLSTANLPLVNLSLAKLSGADLHEADLRSASIVGSYRDCVDLCGADLRSANLHGAGLYDVTLRGANLHDANLRGATLRRVNLEGANLRGAKLGFTNLYWAKLDRAQFDSRTQFSYTVLGDLDLSTAIGLDTSLTSVPPPSGSTRSTAAARSPTP
jgi:hypothetical protein